MLTLNDAFDSVPLSYYTHHPERGETVHRSDPDSIRRELTSLDVSAGARVLEIGTGSGYSSALLAELAGPGGTVVSVDVDPHLVGWANLLHHQRGLTTVRCRHADGMTGYPLGAPYDRIAAWCAAPRLPRAWTDQLTPGGRIVACLPIAALPSTTVIATIGCEDGQPDVQDVTFGGYAQSTNGAVADVLSIPPRWVDWCIPQPAPSWIAIAWRADDDWLHTGARTALEQLLTSRAHRNLRAGTHGLAVLECLHRRPRRSTPQRGRTARRNTGHRAHDPDRTILADGPASPSLQVLRHWLQRWERAGRPAAAAFTPVLVPDDGDDLPGWNLRMSL